MNNNFLLYLIFSTFSVQTLCQTIEVGALYSSGNPEFYKNVPGLVVAYNYNLKNQYLFSQVSGSFKNYDYFQTGNCLVVGKLYSGSLKIGIAQKIISNKNSGFSIGGYASINYFKSENEWTFYNNEPITKIPVLKKLYNKPGIGGFIDFEIKNVVFYNTSLFSRLGYEIISYEGPQLLGSNYWTSNIKDLNFAVGFKVDLKSENSCRNEVKR